MIWFWELSWLWKMLGVALLVSAVCVAAAALIGKAAKIRPGKKVFLLVGILAFVISMSYRSGPLFRSGARFGLSILPLHTSSMVLLHAACNDSTGRPLASKPRWITR